MRAAIRGFSFLVLSLFLVGCVSKEDIDRLKRNQQKLKKNQERILAKLDQIAKRAGQPSRQQPKGPDPNAVYSFPVGSSAIKGNKDAWVTIVEVSDFQ